MGDTMETGNIQALSLDQHLAALRVLGTYTALEASEGNPFPFIEAQWPGVILDDF